MTELAKFDQEVIEGALIKNAVKCDSNECSNMFDVKQDSYGIVIIPEGWSLFQKVGDNVHQVGRLINLKLKQPSVSILCPDCIASKELRE